MQINGDVLSGSGQVRAKRASLVETGSHRELRSREVAMVVGRTEQRTTRRQISDYWLLAGAALALLISAGMLFGLVRVPF